MEYCILQEDAYKNCWIPKQAKELLHALKEQGTSLRVLTQEWGSYAYFAKVDFVHRNYGEYFSSYRQVLFVADANDKIKLMEAVCTKYEINHDECLLVEDTFSTCIKAVEAGFRAMHVSEILDMQINYEREYYNTNSEYERE